MSNDRDQSIEERVLQVIEEHGLRDTLPEGFYERLIAGKAEAEEQRKPRRRARVMNTNQPYQNRFFDHTLRALIEKKGIQFSESDAALKSVALVGALIPDTDRVRDGIFFADDMWGDDRDQILGTMKTLSDAGIPLHPEMNFQIYNLLPPVQSDFLVAALPSMYGPDVDCVKFPDADLVCICCIPKNGATPMHFDYDVSRGYKELTYDELLADRNMNIHVSVSRMSNEYNIWADASFELGAKFVQIRGGTGDEVSTEHFKDHKDALTLIDTDHRQYGDFGIVAHAPSLPAYAEHANPDTKLGAAILDHS